jgi:fluoroacetyl-CoA thioesterase
MTKTNKTLEPGLSGESATLVTDQDTAIAFGSGLVQVFSTPAMIGLMEGACVACTEGCLEEGLATVGTEISIRHVAATPVGMQVFAKAELTAVEGRRLSFKVWAFDEKELIGEGTHERYIIKVEPFFAKAQAKL